MNMSMQNKLLLVVCLLLGLVISNSAQQARIRGVTASKRVLQKDNKNDVAAPEEPVTPVPVETPVPQQVDNNKGGKNNAQDDDLLDETTPVEDNANDDKAVDVTDAPTAAIIESIVEAPNVTVDTINTTDAGATDAGTTDGVVTNGSLTDVGATDGVTDNAVTDNNVTDNAVSVTDVNATENAGVQPGEKFSVPLVPFLLTVDGNINASHFDLEAYLLEHMKKTLPNLVDVTLEVHDASELAMSAGAPQDIVDSIGNSSRSRRRDLAMLRNRVLTATKYYFEGNATFEGPPSYTVLQVDMALTNALSDTQALRDHFVANSPPNSTITDVSVETSATEPETTAPTDAASTDAPASTQEGLTSTGMAIVIGASCIGGISLLIIICVGVSGPSESKKGVKGALPEQPLN